MGDFSFIYNWHVGFKTNTLKQNKFISDPQSFVRNFAAALMKTSLDFITEQKLKNVIDLSAQIISCT